jgi:hypothetical protein
MRIGLVLLTCLLALPLAPAAALAGLVGTLTADGNDSVAVMAERVEAQIYHYTALALRTEYSYLEDASSDRKDRWIFTFTSDFTKDSLDRADSIQIDDPDFGGVDRGSGNLLNNWFGSDFPPGTTTGQMTGDILHQSRSWACPWCAYSAVSSGSDAGTLSVTLLMDPTGKTSPRVDTYSDAS